MGKYQMTIMSTWTETHASASTGCQREQILKFAGRGPATWAGKRSKSLGNYTEVFLKKNTLFGILSDKQGITSQKTNLYGVYPYWDIYWALPL